MKHNFFRPGADVVVTGTDGRQYAGVVIRNAEVDNRFGYIVEPRDTAADGPQFVPVTDLDRPPSGGVR